ncbi:hypothetical protein IVB40_07495 [Bradyrhizobium sp. 40]|uniref:hypothetical protein n=1 Tax=Bradyrhizobium sp. 40 TaxID=2782674 RepID=UPI0020004356|nr:hypothetical protein [Bradyrhizobium sp. 40]UPJ43904.1 hypothetical protein IVB40_07495 [Bradyrhizobium sp. 40]
MAKKSVKTERSARAEIAAKQRAYLRDTFKELGITASGAASALGLSASTFTRFLKLPDASEKMLSTRTMTQVEQLRQVNSDSSMPTTAQAAWGAVHEEAVRVILEGKSGEQLARVLAALIGDRIGIEPWQLHTRALELEGFMPGDIVLVDQNASPRPGDAVYATVEEHRGRSEPIMRLFQHAGPVNVLVARTMDPKAPPALVVDRDRVVIRGVLLPHRLSGKLAA